MIYNIILVILLLMGLLIVIEIGTYFEIGTDYEGKVVISLDNKVSSWAVSYTHLTLPTTPYV